MLLEILIVVAGIGVMAALSLWAGVRLRRVLTSRQARWAASRVAWLTAGLLTMLVGALVLLDTTLLGSPWSPTSPLALLAMSAAFVGGAAWNPDAGSARVALTTLSVVAIPIASFTLLLGVVGLPSVRAVSRSPDGHMVAEMIEGGHFWRNVIVRLRPRSAWLPGGQKVYTITNPRRVTDARFLWSRDSHHVLVMGPNLDGQPHACLATGEWLYLLIEARRGTARSNSADGLHAGFEIAELAGIDFGTSFAPGVPRRRGNLARCEPSR